MRERQGGYILIMVVVMLFLVASIAMMLNHESAINAKTTSGELEAARAEYVTQAAMRHALWRAQNNACMGDVAIPATTLGADSYMATIAGAAAGTAYTLSADQDAWIDSGVTGSNKGGDSILHIKGDAGDLEQPIYRFDLSSLPAGAQINSGSAFFFVSGEHPEGPVTVHRVTAGWNEGDVTWDSISSSVDSSILTMIPAQPDKDVWVQVNITAQVQAWVNGEPNHGILLASNVPGVHGDYASREDGAHAPRLEVVVGSGPASPVNIQATGTLDNGVTRTLSRPVMPAYQPPSTAVLQLGTDPGADAMLDDFYPRNYGGADYFQVNENTGNWLQRPVLRFNLADIPAHAAVLSARLELNVMSVAAPGTATIHRVTRNWLEGTKSGGGAADGATWATYDGTNSWTRPGGDFDAAPVAETAINGGETWVSWEIGPLVEQWLAGAPNDGLLIKGDGTLREARFAARENSNTGVQPKLTITYACECGTACMAPQGAGNVLMVVVNPTTLVPADATKKALFESWGYTVNVISESANAATYGSEAANNDVVFISETVNSNQVGTKLVDLSVGVVSQDGDYNSDLGFAGGSSWPVSPAISVIDASHYITSIFPAVPLDIYSGGMEQLTVSGGTAAGLQTLATTGGAGSLVVLDVGAITNGGSPAAGRRVMLPLGRGAGLNWDYLNNNGRLMVQRALAWGMGANSGGESGNILLVVVDPNNLTPQEAAKQALMESWSFTVDLIDESASQGEFDAAVAANDVAYVAEDINSGALGTKLREATIGVVIEEEKITDEFGISSGETTFTEASIEITDNTHYITQPFSLGAVTFSSSAQPVGGRAGTLAPGLAVLALRPSSSTSMLDAIDTGGVLFDTGSAAGRRVKLPWGGNEFDINALTADGLNIMQRAIEWAAGAGAAATSPIAHWKLDDGTGLTAVDSEGGYDGTLVNGPAWVAGQLGDALSFDGNDDYIDVGSMNPMSYDDFTIVTWYKSADTSVSDDEYIFNHGSGTADELAFGPTDDVIDKLRLGINAGGSWDPHYGSSDIVDQQWHHLVAVRDSGRIRLYVDNVEESDALDANAGSTLTIDGYGPFIGDYPGATEQVHGILDDVRLYDRALTATEISDLFTAGGGGGGGGGEGGGGTFLDQFNTNASFAGNDGTLSWTADWFEINESDGAGSGDEVVMNAPGGGFLIQVQDNDSGGEGVGREADLSGYTSATLTFIYWRIGLDNANDYVTVEVSDNGGSTWNEIDRFEGPASDTTGNPQSASYDISTYIAPNTQIRFMTSPNLANNERVRIDDVQIEVSN